MVELIRNTPDTAGAASSIPGSGSCPGEGNATCSSMLAGRSHGQRSLAGYSVWGGKESDVTEQLSVYMYIYNKYVVSYI